MVVSACAKFGRLVRSTVQRRTARSWKRMVEKVERMDCLRGVCVLLASGGIAYLS